MGGDDAPDEQAAREEFDRQIAEAAAGNWAELGLEPGPLAEPAAFEPVSIQEFLT